MEVEEVDEVMDEVALVFVLLLGAVRLSVGKVEVVVVVEEEVVVVEEVAGGGGGGGPIDACLGLFDILVGGASRCAPYPSNACMVKSTS